jgi:hypothetical protein
MRLVFNIPVEKKTNIPDVHEKIPKIYLFYLFVAIGKINLKLEKKDFHINDFIRLLHIKNYIVQSRFQLQISLIFCLLLCP